VTDAFEIGFFTQGRGDSSVAISVRLFALLAVATLAACASTPPPKAPAARGQPFAAAVAMICDVDREAGLSPDANPLGIGIERSAWIADNVDNPDGIELRVLLSVKGAADQACMLRDRATEVGIPRCALADSLASSGIGGLAP
jgi:hypothetical protein